MVETQLHKLMLTVLMVAPVIPLSSDDVALSVLFSDISSNVLLRVIENAAVSVKLLARLAVTMASEHATAASTDTAAIKPSCVRQSF